MPPKLSNKRAIEPVPGLGPLIEQASCGRSSAAASAVMRSEQLGTSYLWRSNTSIGGRAVCWA